MARETPASRNRRQAAAEQTLAQAPVEQYAERTYADALTPEHAAVLRAAGQHPDQE